ncbi:hypothetical protein MLD38_024695 [Melastoma candidum]|uniref:Uncharacterized protein n=1 Tax=Melastoma candidum TaxID=119954 RepID=A0ACB9NT60_9MYRT|nr:hypothetical protein MLD38_024695 [Melastoma candidum]
MLRQSPSRNHRAVNGFKVKHALQVFLLLAICTWLLYQVRHGKQEGEDAQGVDPQGETTEGERMKFGRKELRLRQEMGNTENRSREEEEDEPGDGFEEMEVEGRGVGDDEIDGSDQEAAEEGDIADELAEDFGDKEDKETEEWASHSEDASLAAEEDESKGKLREDQGKGFLQDQQKGNAASDASSHSTA